MRRFAGTFRDISGRRWSSEKLSPSEPLRRRIEGRFRLAMTTREVGKCWPAWPFLLRRTSSTETTATASIEAAMEDSRSNSDGPPGGDVLLVGLLGGLITKLSVNLLAPATV